MPIPTVLFAERASRALSRGFDQMAELLALTLGPTQGAVLNDRESMAPEIITDAASAARRVLALPDRAAEAGALLLRNTAWRVHRRAGDGVATAAVLAQAILREANRYVQAGGNPILVKRGVERAMWVAVDGLARRAQPVIGEEDLTRVAETITAEPAMSLVLGEMFDVLGPTAHITVEDYVAPYLERAYYEGGRWRARLESPYLITDAAGKRAVQQDCQVVLYAGRLEQADDVEPLLTLLARGDKRPLLLVAEQVSGGALNALVLNHHRGAIKAVVVSTRRVGSDKASDFADLAVLTGATLLGSEVGRTLADLDSSDFGRARRVEATADNLVISGGGGEAAARRERVEQLRAYLTGLQATDEGREAARLRLARMAGGVGVLMVGAYSEAERTTLRQKAEKAIGALRVAMEEGVAPGGGVAYVLAAEAVRRSAVTLKGDERQGALILSRALEEPFRRIVRNRGATDPAVALAEVRRRGEGYVYDAMADRVTTVAESGLLDPAGVLRIALETAVSGAMMALTVAALVLHRKPQQSTEP